jgi:tRNA1(Val) A37 N6-methylase TrmN6
MLLNGQVTLWQLARGYRAAIDPVLLAATLSPRPGSRVLDLGCGAGAITFCLLARCPDIDVIGLEINSDLVALARRNTGENGASQQFQIYQGTVASPPDEIKAGSFDVVVSNPPYLESGRATISPDAGKHVANMESDADLSAWINAASRALKPKGRLTGPHIGADACRFRRDLHPPALAKSRYRRETRNRSGTQRRLVANPSSARYRGASGGWPIHP